KNVGKAKTVTVSGISLSGPDAGNYTVNNSVTAKADITAWALTVTATAANKPYDGTTTATVTVSDDRLPGDMLTDGYTTAAFTDKNVGTVKPVTVVGVSISGTGAGNYALQSTTVVAKADI